MQAKNRIFFLFSILMARIAFNRPTIYKYHRPMNKCLDHLPLSRQKHLEYIVDVIRDEFEQVTGFL